MNSHRFLLLAVSTFALITWHQFRHESAVACGILAPPTL
jgi:hypothetical protein